MWNNNWLRGKEFRTFYSGIIYAGRAVFYWEHLTHYKINLDYYKKLSEDLIAYFPLIGLGPHRKRLQQFFFVVETSLLSCYLATIRGYKDRPTGSPSIRHVPHKKLRVQQFVYCCMCIHCCGNVFTEPLLSTERRDTLNRAFALQQYEGYTYILQTDGRDLWSTPLGWPQLPWYTYQVS
jgi:hypothetical protein